MMRSGSVLASGAVFLAMIASPAYAAAADAPRLSPAQASVIAGEIAKLKYPQERSLASHWSDAKKVAEFICRPLATAVLALAFVGVNVMHLGTGEPVLFNARFATYLIAIAVFIFATWLSTRSPNEWRPIALGAGIGATVLVMIAVCLEIHSYWMAQTSIPRSDLYIYEQFSYSAWAMLFGAALLSAGFWKKSAFLRWQALALLTLSIAKVFLVDTRQLSQGYRILSFLGLGVLLLAVSFVYQRDWLGLRSKS